MRVVDLKALVKERGLRGYSRLKKAELIAFIRQCTRPPLRPMPAPRLRLIPAIRPRPIPALRAMPAPRPIPAPRPPELKPYQLKPKRGKETFIEPSPTRLDSEGFKCALAK